VPPRRSGFGLLVFSLGSATGRHGGAVALCRPFRKHSFGCGVFFSLPFVRVAFAKLRTGEAALSGRYVCR